MPNSQSPPCTFTAFITASVRQGSKQSLHTRNLDPGLYTTALVSTGKVKLKRSKPSARTNTNTHADTFLYARRSYVVVNDFR